MNVIKLKSVVLDRLTDAEFWQFCLDNQSLHIERDADHQLTIRLAAGLVPGVAGELLAQLDHWNQQRQQGRLSDASFGFTLPTGAMLLPTASWIAQDRWDSLGAADRHGFARICPDFVAELLATADYLPDLMTKMEQWVDGGAQLAWLLMPASESIFIFEPGQPVRAIQGFDQKLSGDPVLADFALELQALRRG